MLDASRRSKTFLQIGQQLRYFPTVRECVRQIHSGDLFGQHAGDQGAAPQHAH